MLVRAGAAAPLCAFSLPRRGAALCGAWRAAGRPPRWSLDATLASAAAADRLAALPDAPSTADLPRLVGLVVEYLAICAEADGGDDDSAPPPRVADGTLPDFAKHPFACCAEALAEPRLGRWADSLAAADFEILFPLAWIAHALDVAGLLHLIATRIALYPHIARGLGFPDRIWELLLNDRKVHALRAALDRAARAVAKARAAFDTRDASNGASLGTFVARAYPEIPETHFALAPAAASLTSLDTCERALRAVAHAAKAASEAFDPSAQLVAPAVQGAARMLFGSDFDLAVASDNSGDSLIAVAMAHARARLAARDSARF